MYYFGCNHIHRYYPKEVPIFKDSNSLNSESLKSKAQKTWVIHIICELQNYQIKECGLQKDLCSNVILCIYLFTLLSDIMG